MNFYWGVMALTAAVTVLATYMYGGREFWFQEDGLTRPRQMTGKIFLLLLPAVVVLTLVAGFRVKVGTDYPAYVVIFERVLDGNFGRFETGFVYLTMIAAAIFSAPASMFLASALITNLGFFWGIASSTLYPALSVFLYQAMLFWFFTLNGVRQGIAMGFTFASFHFIRTGKHFWHIATILVASTFHKSVLIALPFSLILRIRLKSWIYIALTIISIPSIYAANTLLPFIGRIFPEYKWMARPQDFTYTISEAMLLAIILSVALLYLGYRRKSAVIGQNDLTIYKNLTFVSLLLHTTFAWIPWVERLWLYFDMFYIVMIPNLILHAFGEKRQRIWATILISGVYLAYITISVGLNNSHQVVPYGHIFAGN